MQMSHWEWLARGVEIVLGLGLVPLLWKANRLLNKLWDMFQEFPLHRHEGDRIIYPKGMKPDAADTLSDQVIRSRA